MRHWVYNLESLVPFESLKWLLSCLLVHTLERNGVSFALQDFQSLTTDLGFLVQVALLRSTTHVKQRLIETVDFCTFDSFLLNGSRKGFFSLES